MDFLRRKSQVVNSALWAAFGDAIGFPTELVSDAGVQRRLGSPRAETLMPWSRIVGGKFGQRVRLPAGSYSDDTQLRLATSRAIQASEGFDVESFSKVELPVWLSYALGAGKGSKAAASALTSSSAAWFSNFFDTKASSYVQGGGNGACMRIQPHVWAAPNLSDPFSYQRNVIRNSVCTHGHMRGIAGATVHAASLAYVLDSGRLPDERAWINFTRDIQIIPYLVEEDSDLSTFWRPAWEEASGCSLNQAVEIVCEEWVQAVLVARSRRGESDVERYAYVLDSLGGRSAAERGSGLKSALFALVGAREFEGRGVRRGLIEIANQLGSDTDTIASMVGALMGATHDSEKGDSTVQDAAYLASEAERLNGLAFGRAKQPFRYPDLLFWHPPKTASDAVLIDEDGFSLIGLGRLKLLEEAEPPGNRDSSYRWFSCDFGQTLLCKVRDNPRFGSAKTLADYRPRPEFRPSTLSLKAENKGADALDLFNRDGQKFAEKLAERSEQVARVAPPDVGIDALTNRVISSGFDPKLIGSIINELCERDNYLELIVAFSAIIAKAKHARGKKK
jgi:ADP-ribosylglycohydrolase